MTVEGSFTYSIYQKDDGNYFTHTNSSDTTRLMDTPFFEHFENHPKKLVAKIDNKTTTAANNLLSSSFAGWDSGTGAVQLGDYVYFLRTPTGDNAEREIFAGSITELSQDFQGILTIKAECFLKRAELKKASKLIHSNYRDYLYFPVTTSSGQRYVEDVTDASIQYPFAFIGFAHTDVQVTLGDGSANANIIIWDDSEGTPSRPVAQAFIADGDALIGVNVKIYVDGACTPSITVSLQKDNGNNEPDGVTIGSFTDDATAYLGAQDADLSGSFIDGSDNPTEMYVGQKYWLITEVGDGDGIDIYAHSEDPDTSQNGVITTCLHKTDGSTWSTKTDENIQIVYNYGLYESVSEENYYFVDSTNVIYLLDDKAITSWDTYNRLKISYYYGTKVLEDVFDSIIEHDLDINPDSDSDLDLPINTFSTYGRTFGDCLRELADAAETSGAWDGYQHTVSSYITGTDPYNGTKYIKMGKRKKVGDAVTRVFSDSSATDDHNRIISVALSQTSSFRPSSVTIIGKDFSGNPVIKTIHDKAYDGTGSSLGQRSKDCQHHETIYNEYITNLTDANNAAIAYMDRYKTNVWEGTITVSGVFYDLFDLTDTGETYGSGNIITLTYSPLGISALDMKVKGIQVDATTTTIFLTNADMVAENKFKSSIKKTEENQGFLAPVGLVDTAYIQIYDDSTDFSSITDDPIYMTLQTNAAADINNIQRVACTELVDDDTDRNLRSYIAVFEKWNGYTDSGTPVGLIKLYSAKTGGTLRATYDLQTAGAPVNDETFYKWKSLRLIIEYTCKNG